MNDRCRRRKNCRLCNSNKIEECFKLKSTPPANAFIEKEKISEEQEHFPLEIFFCKECYHIQILDIVDPKILFENYVYVSGTSPVFVKHFEDYANYILKNYSKLRNSLVIDVGSNDGTLLQFFKKEGNRVLGVDPAKKISQKANSQGIETLNGFFDYNYSQEIKKKFGKAGIITANNVFAHIDDLNDFVHGVRELLSEDGIFVFEVSYLADVINDLLFDTIYHEHLSYHSVIPLISFFDKNEMTLIEANRIDSHGGSLRCVVKLKKNVKLHIKESVENGVKLERKMGLNKIDTYRDFFTRMENKKNELQKLFKKLKSENKTIIGFGAPAKATTFMYQFCIDEKIIDFIIDDSPLKQGLFSPGMHIPVYSSQKIYEEKPDYIIILAWNFAQSIMEKHKKFKDNGGHFIIPLPKLEVN
jgi:SAM-dependent methyltransferase